MSEQTLPTEEQLVDIILGSEQRTRYMYNGALALTMMNGKPAPWAPQGVSMMDHMRIQNTVDKPYAPDEEHATIVVRIGNKDGEQALVRYFSMDAADANILSKNNVAVILEKLKAHLDIYTLTSFYRYDERDGERKNPEDGVEIIPLDCKEEV